MSLSQILSEYNSNIQQCENLIANAHKIDDAGNSIFPIIDQRQITVAGFLNMFIAWENFLELSLIEFMTGSLPINGNQPQRFVCPGGKEEAQNMIQGTNRFFDYANHQFFSKTVNNFFKGGYPYQPHFGIIQRELDDLRTMRNASAHISKYTQNPLDSLATRLFNSLEPNILLYDVLTKVIPHSSDTVFNHYKKILLVTAEKIANG